MYNQYNIYFGNLNAKIYKIKLRRVDCYIMTDKEVELNIGDPAPDFCIPDKDNKEVCLKDFRGKYTIVYFYPKDNTPGCTTEAIGFTNILPELQELNAEVIGISPDSPKSHASFIEKKNLKVTLLSDENKNVLKKYRVWGMKKFMIFI